MSKLTNTLRHLLRMSSASSDNGFDENQSLLSNNDRQIQNNGTSVYNEGGANVVATFFNFAKSSIGSGSFALPIAVLSAGVVVGSAGMVLLALISVYTMQLMLECKVAAVSNLPVNERKGFTYSQLGREAMGAVGKWMVDFAVLGCNLGVCAGYMIFISSNLRYAFTCYSYTHTNICFSTWELYAMVVPVLIFLTYLPSFKWLAYAAYVGTAFLAVAMITVFVYGFNHEFKAFSDDFTVSGIKLALAPPSWLGVAQWFGVTAFLFCVHSMLIPLECGMKEPKYMPHLIDVACLVVIGINLPFALYGYFLFGNSTEGYIFENLPGGVFNDMVRLFLSLELTLTFPIVFKPAAEVMEEILQGVMLRIQSSFNQSWIFDLYAQKSNFWKIMNFIMVCSLRTVLVLLSWGLAISIPRFDLCLAFVGSLATSALAFVLPPLFHLKLKRKSVPMWRNVLHIVILVLGIAATVTATSINLYFAITSKSSAKTCKDIQEICIA